MNTPLSSEPPVEILEAPPEPVKENTEPRFCRFFGTSNKMLCLCEKDVCVLGKEKYGSLEEAKAECVDGS